MRCYDLIFEIIFSSKIEIEITLMSIFVCYNTSGSNGCHELCSLQCEIKIDTFKAFCWNCAGLLKCWWNSRRYVILKLHSIRENLKRKVELVALSGLVELDKSRKSLSEIHIGAWQCQWQASVKVRLDLAEQSVNVYLREHGDISIQIQRYICVLVQEKEGQNVRCEEPLQHFPLSQL